MRLFIISLSYEKLCVKYRVVFIQLHTYGRKCMNDSSKDIFCERFVVVKNLKWNIIIESLKKRLLSEKKSDKHKRKLLLL